MTSSINAHKVTQSRLLKQWLCLIFFFYGWKANRERGTKKILWAWPLIRKVCACLEKQFFRNSSSSRFWSERPKTRFEFWKARKGKQQSGAQCEESLYGSHPMEMGTRKAEHWAMLRKLFRLRRWPQDTRRVLNTLFSEQAEDRRPDRTRWPKKWPELPSLCSYPLFAYIMLLFTLYQCVCQCVYQCVLRIDTGIMRGIHMESNPSSMWPSKCRHCADTAAASLPLSLGKSQGPSHYFILFQKKTIQYWKGDFLWFALSNKLLYSINFHWSC